MSGSMPAALAKAFIAACEDELAAPKPGNVHVFAAGHGMEARDFIESARVAAPLLTAPGISVGARLLAAVEATFARVGQNTNLGIILLCAPLASAALNFPQADLRAGVERTLVNLDLCDATLAFKAIARANPGGLGSAPEHDVSRPADVTLLEAMQAAAGRDRIAYQYAYQYSDIFDLGFASLGASRRAGASKKMATLRLYLDLLCAFPDSHVVRKFGVRAGDELLDEARAFSASLRALPNEERIQAAALEWDQELKEKKLNPGTSADLTVATLFADYVVGVLANARKNG